MCGGLYHLQIKAHPILYFRSEASDSGAGHGDRPEERGLVSEHADQFAIPCLCDGAYKLCSRRVRVLGHHLPGQKIVEVIGDEQQMLCLPHQFRFVRLDRHQLIDGVEDLLLDPRARIERLRRDDLIYLLIYSLCTMVTIAVGISEYSSFPVKKHIVHRPCIDPHTDRDLPELFAFLQSAQDLFEEHCKIPAEMPVLFHQPVLKTVDLLCADHPVLHMAEDVAPAGSSDIDCKIVLFHIVLLS